MVFNKSHALIRNYGETANVAASNLFLVDGSSRSLALLHSFVSRKHLGDEINAPQIDQLHHAMQLWKEVKSAATW